MNHLEQYILNEKGILLNEGVGEYWDDAKGFLVKYGKEFVPEFFGTPKGKKIPWSKIGIRSTLNSSPSNVAVLKGSLAKFFSEKNLDFLAKQFQNEQTIIGDADDFKEVMTPGKFKFFRDSIARESKTLHRLVHNMVHGRESSAIKYKQADVIDRWKLRIGNAGIGGEESRDIHRRGGAAVMATAGASATLVAGALKAGPMLAGLSTGGFLVFLATLAAAGEWNGWWDVFNDDAKGADEADIVKKIKEILKEYIEEGDEQYHGEGPYSRKEKRYKVGDAETLESNFQGPYITDFLVEQLAERYRRWFMGDMKDKAAKAKADGQTAVDWRGHSTNTKSKKSATDKKGEVKKGDVAKKAAEKKAAVKKGTEKTLPAAPAAAIPYYCPNKEPHNKVFCENEPLWALEARNLQMYKLTGKDKPSLKLYLKSKREAGGDLDKQKALITARINFLEEKYVKMNGATSAVAGVPTVGKKRVAAKISKSSSGSAATAKQNALLKGTSHGNVKGLQKTLMGLGFFSVKPTDINKSVTFTDGEPDGKVGRETRTAIKNLQTKLGARADGVYGSDTHTKWVALSKGGAPEGANFVRSGPAPQSAVAEGLERMIIQEIDKLIEERRA